MFLCNLLLSGDLLNIRKFLSCLFGVGVHGQGQDNEFVNDWCGVEWSVLGESLRNLRLSSRVTLNLVRGDELVKEALGLCHSLSK